MLADQDIAALKALLSFPRELVILSHRNPDGDAIGSSLAWSLYLQTLGHKTTVIFPSEYPEVFEWMPQSADILIYDLQPQQAESVEERAELIFCLDFNGLDRIDKLGLKVDASRSPKIMIDHHLDPEPFADIQFSTTQVSSTAELVYRLIIGLQGHKSISTEIAECVYVGIMTDTGSFHHATSGDLYRIVADLKDGGLDDTRVQELVNNSLPDKYLRLLGHCLNNRMELIPEWNLGIIHLSREDYRNFDIRRGDTEGIINYLMMLKSVRVGVMVMNQPSIVKLSMRSKGTFSVQAICRDHFSGGGHRNASGGYAKSSLEDAIKKLKEVFPSYLVPEKIENS